MKRKHYPAVTILGAVALTFVPLLLLSIGLNFRDRMTSESKEDLSLQRFTENALKEPTRVAEASSKKTPDGKVSDMPIAGNPQTSSWVPNVPVMATLRQKASAQPDSEVASPSAGAGADATEIGIENTTDRVPYPFKNSEPVVDAVPIDSATDADPSFLDITELTPSEIAAREVDQATLEMPRRPSVDESYYSATGHPALVTQTQVPDPLSQVQTTVSQEQGVSGKDPALKTRENRSRKPGDDGKETEVTNSPPDADKVSAQLTEPPGKDQQAETVVTLEEVALQTPTENAAVGRVEDVVATTRAKGWPIALVKSDLPGDVWWVQQVVGIHGNAFAARVNFGNEYSIRGTIYHMVIVFLDSPDEVRRFRIAKQFEEIPRGVRRSREFNFIRN